MPKKGYKSVTVREVVYDRFQQEWLKNKPSYVKKGITSIAGFIAYLLEEEISKRLPTSNEPHFFMRNHDDRGVKVWDSEMKMHADIQITPKGIYCPLCDARKCEHIRFALKQRDVWDYIQRRIKEGWKIELPEELT